jgi:hypothetical protein
MLKKSFVRVCCFFLPVLIWLAPAPILHARWVTPTSTAFQLAVKEFDTRGTLKADEAVFLTDIAQGELIWHKELIVVDRTRTKQALTDLGLSQETCSDIDCLVRLGKFLRVQKIMTGTIGKIGSAFAISIQVIDVESGRLQIMKNANHQGSVEGLSPVITDLVKQIIAALLDEEPATTTGSHKSFFSFDAPEFSNVTLSADLTYYGADYTSNTYSRITLRPMLLSVSYSLTPSIFAMGSAGILRGDYGLLKPTSAQFTNLLKGRSKLWGDNLSSYILGVGCGYRVWKIRGGIEYTSFFSKDTDLSPDDALVVHAAYYIVHSAYIGLSMWMFDLTGLIDPAHIGSNIPTSEYGITRRGWTSPTLFVLRAGVDF